MEKKTGLLLYNDNKDILLINGWELPKDIQNDSDDLISSLISFKTLTKIELNIDNFNFINLGSHNNTTIFALEYLDETNFQIKHNWTLLEDCKKNTNIDDLEFINRIEKYFLEDNNQEVDDFDVSNSINPLEPIDFNKMNVQEKRNFYQNFLNTEVIEIEESILKNDIESGVLESLGVNKDTIEWANLLKNIIYIHIIEFAEKLKTDQDFYSKTLKQLDTNDDDSFVNSGKISLDGEKVDKFIKDNLSKTNNIKMEKIELDFIITFISDTEFNKDYFSAFFNDTLANLDGDILKNTNIVYDLYVPYKILDIKDLNIETLQNYLQNYEDLDTFIDGQLVHEMTHALEFIERRKNNTHTTSERLINFLIYIFKKDDFLNISRDLKHFLNLVYLDLSFERNARVPQLYIEIKNKDINSTDDFLKIIKTTEVWNDMQQLDFNAQDFYDNLSFNMDENDIDEVLSDFTGNTKDKVLKSFLSKWNEIIVLVNKEWDKNDDIHLKKLTKNDLDNPLDFFKKWEIKFNSDLEDFKRKIDRLFSKLK